MKNFFFGFLVFLVLTCISCKPETGLAPNVNYELYVNNGKDQTPAISPDGQWIAYYHDSQQLNDPIDYPTGLYLMDINGNNRRLLLQGNHWSPSWSPDGQWLVFSSNGVLQIINFDGDSISTFEGLNNVPLQFPDWSDDGKLILFSSSYVEGGGGFICSPKFEDVKQIYTHYQIGAYPVKWAGNSKLVCSVSSHDWQGEEVFFMDTALKVQERLTFNDVNDRDPEFSPITSQIVWSSNMRIHTMNIDGSSQKLLDNGRFPTWSPDGKYIIYSNANEAITKEVLYKIDLYGNNRIQLTF